MFEVSIKVSRHFWARSELHLDAEQWAALPIRFGMDPERAAEVVVNGVPMDVVVAEMQTNRNAVYKTMFDARKKIRAALLAQGHLGEIDRAEAVPS